jgi:hypothetical protein
MCKVTLIAVPTRLSVLPRGIWAREVSGLQPLSTPAVRNDVLNAVRAVPAVQSGLGSANTLRR